MQNGGGIRALPLPPSSPNVPAVYNREPLFSLKGLQQRYAGLPGYIRKPASAAGRFIFPKNPYVRGLMYGVPAFQAAGGVEGIKQKLNPSMETIIERSRRNNLGTRTTTLEELGISPMMDAQQKLATDITEAANQSVPLIPGTDVLSGSVIEKIEENTGITLPPDGGNIVKQADAKDTGVPLEFGFADKIREEGPKLGVGSDFDKDLDERYLVDEPERDTGLEAIRQKNIDEMDSSPTVVKTPKPSDDEPEVTMTDLEKALGLDSARQEYAADALAAASKAFFEGRGFEAIGDAAAVKSKAPDIKRLAGLEEFKADRAEKLYEKKLDAQARLKQGTMGNLQKDILFLRGLTGADRIAALGKLGYKAPSLSAAIKELKITGQAPDAATIKSLAELYIGPDFKGTVDVTEEMSEKPAGTYLTIDGTALIIIDEQGNTRSQTL